MNREITETETNEIKLMNALNLMLMNFNSQTRKWEEMDDTLLAMKGEMMYDLGEHGLIGQFSSMYTNEMLRLHGVA